MTRIGQHKDTVRLGKANIPVFILVGDMNPAINLNACCCHKSGVESHRLTVELALIIRAPFFLIFKIRLVLMTCYAILF